MKKAGAPLPDLLRTGEPEMEIKKLQTMQEIND